MLKPVLVARSTLYFHQWQYVILCRLPEAHILRLLDHGKIDQLIAYRNSWIARRGQEMITLESQEIMHATCDYLLSRPNSYKKVVSGNSIWLYTNTPKDFEDLEHIPTVKKLYINQAQVSLTPGVVILKKPAHSYRTYFRDRWLTNDQLTSLRRYFESRRHMFRLSPGFAKLITGRRMWLTGNLFVDHNEPDADFLINIAVPGVIKKTLSIIARDK